MEKGRQKFCRPRANERRSRNWSYGISLNSNRNLLVVQGCRGEEVLVSGGLLCIISIKEVMALWFKTQDHVNTATQQQRTTTQQQWFPAVLKDSADQFTDASFQTEKCQN